MIRHVKKLVFGKPEHNITVSLSPIMKQWYALEAVWENTHHNDTGLERILRLFVIAVQFLFPGIYIRQSVFRRGQTIKNTLIEIYVLIKLIFPLALLYFDQSHNPVGLSIATYFLLETFTYVSSLVLVSDLHVETKSVNRSILLLLINYLEITINFALIYEGFDMLSTNAITGIDHLYFSFVTSASLGFGDIYPVTQAGKVLVCFQTFVLLVFVVLFINHFGSKRYSKGTQG
jgi:hypothetical protein